MVASGDPHETRVLHKLVQMGYSVSIPFSDSEPYDLVVEVDGDLLKVQVKSCIDHPSGNNSIQSRTARHDGDKQIEYGEDEVDIFALSHSERGVYWVPYEDISGKSITLSLRDNKDHPQISQLASEYRVTERLK